MEKISEIITIEFKYATEEERAEHIKYMESRGYECTGQARKSDDPLTSDNWEYYWYGKFYKRM